MAGNVSASRIFQDLMNQKVWFTVRKAKNLTADSVVVFYQSGTGVRGYATVTEILDNSKSDFETMQNLGLYQLRIRINLEDIVQFDDPVALGPMVDNLEFIANKKYWGHSVRGTPRSISSKDFQKIVKASTS